MYLPTPYSLWGTLLPKNNDERLTHTVPLPILLVKSTMVQSTDTNSTGRD